MANVSNGAFAIIANGQLDATPASRSRTLSWKRASLTS